MQIEDLLLQNLELKEYYYSLPDYVRDKINTHTDVINSAEDLMTYANSISKRDWWGYEA